MIRKIVNPKNNRLIIEIPQEYVGKRVEYIVFPIDTEEAHSNKDRNIASLGGALKAYADLNKLPLEDSAWELHVKEKFTL